MEQKAPSLKDCLVTYVANITALQQKVAAVRHSQEAARRQLAALQEKCRSLRLQLDRQQA